jgi:sugar phosphate isomerase/epimerase
MNFFEKENTMKTNGNVVIGAHQLSWKSSVEPEQIMEIAKFASKAGCGAMELFMNGFQTFPEHAIVQALKEQELLMAGCGVILPKSENYDGDGDPLSTDETQRRRAKNRIITFINWLRNAQIKINRERDCVLAGPLLSVLGQKDAKEPTTKNFEAGLITFREVAKYAQSRHIKIAIEPLQWSETIWPCQANQVIDFIKNVESVGGVAKGQLGILFDIYHALRMEENWADTLRMVLSENRLFHVHVAGPKRTPPDINQHIDWKLMMKILFSEFNYDGIITIESFGAECDLPPEVIGPGNRPPANTVITKGVETLLIAASV